LVDAQAGIPLAQAFGGGEVASADGLRFVVPGTLHDSPFVLDGLLEQQTSLRPTQRMTDTAGYSDLVFGLFWLLGYQFSPRLADLGESRFGAWTGRPRLTHQRNPGLADYGALNGLARQRIKPPLISQNWDDMLRVAGSLKMGTVRASEFIRSLRGGRQSLLGRALGELGRIPKTLHLLNFVDDESYRRNTLTQLDRGEGVTGWDGLFFTANAVSYGSVIGRARKINSGHSAY